MSEEVGPLDFLFCRKCDKHIESAPIFDYEVDKSMMTEENRKQRVAPKITIKFLCPVCRGGLIQKYVTVVVEIKV